MTVPAALATASPYVNGMGITHDAFVHGWCSATTSHDLAKMWRVSERRLRTLQGKMRLPGRVPAHRMGFDAVMLEFEADCLAGAIDPDYAMPIVLVKAPPAVPPISAPFWTPQRDAAVIATGGHYAKISALAASLGIPSARVTGRWHLVRGR